MLFRLTSIILFFLISNLFAVEEIPRSDYGKYDNIPRQLISEDDVHNKINKYGKCYGSDKNKNLIVVTTNKSFDAGIACYVNKDRDYHKALRKFTDPLADQHCNKNNLKAIYRGPGLHRDSLSSSDITMGLLTGGLSLLVTSQNNVIANSYVCDGLINASNRNTTSSISFFQTIILLAVVSVLGFYLYKYISSRSFDSLWKNKTKIREAKNNKDSKSKDAQENENTSDLGSVEDEKKYDQVPIKKQDSFMSGHKQWIIFSIIFGVLFGFSTGEAGFVILLPFIIYFGGRLSYNWLNLIGRFLNGESIYDYIMYGDGNYSKKEFRNRENENFDNNGEVFGYGSSFFINENGYVVTNFHVIQPFLNKEASKVTLHVKDKEYSVTVHSVDMKNDLAVLKTNDKNDNYFNLSEVDADRLDPVTTIGFGFGPAASTEVKITKGVVSAIAGIQNDYSRMQIDAVIQGGNSGGPTINDNGLVTGVVVEKFSGRAALELNQDIPEGISFAIKVSTLKQFLKSNKIKYYESNNSDKPLSKLEINNMIDKAVPFVVLYK